MGFLARIENSWDAARAGDGGEVWISNDRVVRSVVREAKLSYDEIRIGPERSRRLNLERWDRAKKLETSTEVNPPTLRTIDSTFSFRHPSPLGVNDETIAARAPL